MRWIWIDTIVEFEPKRRMVAIKNVTRAEEHLQHHFAAEGDLPADAIMPASLIIEGMAQTAGILTGSIHRGQAVQDLPGRALPREPDGEPGLGERR